MAGGAMHEPALGRAVDYLVQTQLSDGTWDEAAFTGTGFPRAFYLRYHMYPTYFPLIALARYGRATGVLANDDH